MQETLTLDQLQLLLSVAETGSFSGAGKQLGRVPSAVGYGISKLEDALNLVLFDRSGKRPVLTEAGHTLLIEARQVLARVSELRSRAALMESGMEASVSIAVSAIFPATHLIKLCQSFQRQFPSISLRIETGVLAAVSELVLNGTCQLGIVSDAAPDLHGLRKRFVARVQLAPVASSRHPLAQLAGPLTCADVHDHAQIVISSRESVSGQDVGVLSALTWRVADAGTKLALIRAGLGWGMLPLAMVEEHTAHGELVALVVEKWGAPPLSVSLSSVVAESAPLGPAAQWIVGQLPKICGG